MLTLSKTNFREPETLTLILTLILTRTPPKQTLWSRLARLPHLNKQHTKHCLNLTLPVLHLLESAAVVFFFTDLCLIHGSISTKYTVLWSDVMVGISWPNLPSIARHHASCLFNKCISLNKKWEVYAAVSSWARCHLIIEHKMNGSLHPIHTYRMWPWSGRYEM